MDAAAHVELSKKQLKAARRESGIELLILWPRELGPEPQLREGRERLATQAERAAADELMRQACRLHGLVILHYLVTCVRRPLQRDLEAGGELRAHMALSIVGREYADVRSRIARPGGVLCYAHTRRPPR